MVLPLGRKYTVSVMATKDTANDADGLTGNPPEEGALELRILRAIRRIIQAVDIHSRQLAGEFNITTPQLVTLLYVVSNGPLTASDIAQHVHLSNSTVVGILDRLEAKDLVRRARSTDDRRQVFVSATEKGHTLAQSAPSPLQYVFAKALNRLPALEQTAIALSLERIVDLMEARDIDAAPVLESGEMKRSTDPLK